MDIQQTCLVSFIFSLYYPANKPIGSPGWCMQRGYLPVSMNARKSLENNPLNWGFCDMKKKKCQGHDTNSPPYSNEQYETGLLMVNQKQCTRSLNRHKNDFQPKSELCATGQYTITAQEINRSKHRWKKGKLEAARKRGRCYWYCITSTKIHFYLSNGI